MFAHEYTARDAFRAMHSDFRRMRRNGERGPGHWDRDLGLVAAVNGAVRRMGRDADTIEGMRRASIADALRSAAEWRMTAIRLNHKRWLSAARAQIEHARDMRTRRGGLPVLP